MLYSNEVDNLRRADTLSWLHQSLVGVWLRLQCLERIIVKANTLAEVMRKYKSLDTAPLRLIELRLANTAYLLLSEVED